VSWRFLGGRGVPSSESRTNWNVVEASPFVVLARSAFVGGALGVVFSGVCLS
jgi:hypothetical protein